MNYPTTSFNLSILEKRSNRSISERLSILKDLILYEHSFCASTSLYFLEKLMKEAGDDNLIYAKILIERLSRQANKRILKCQAKTNCNLSNMK